jgi:hypothetical protein
MIGPELEVGLILHSSANRPVFFILDWRYALQFELPIKYFLGINWPDFLYLFSFSFTLNNLGLAAPQRQYLFSCIQHDIVERRSRSYVHQTSRRARRGGEKWGYFTILNGTL